MLFWIILEVLAFTSLAFGQLGKRHASPKAYLSRRQANGSLDSIEVAAHSRLPNLPLPQSISSSTKSLLQFITIWEDSETATISATLGQIAQNNSGYTDFGNFTRDEVVGILKTNLAVSCSGLSFYLGRVTDNIIRKLSSSSTTQFNSLNTTRCLWSQWDVRKKARS
jgi:hypothetical protein